MKKFKFWFGIFLTAVGVCALVVCTVGGVVNLFRYPDMTEMRRLLEFPEFSIIAIGGAISIYFGAFIVGRS